MPAGYERARSFLEGLLHERSLAEMNLQLEPKRRRSSPKLPGLFCLGMNSLEQRWELTQAGREQRETLADTKSMEHKDYYRHNIENFIGTVKLPVGLAGPLRVNGIFAQGEYYVPLATTEAALVASYHRGAQLITDAGGCTAMLLNEGVSRAPGFVFDNLRQVGLFVAWTLTEFETFQHVAKSTTTHGKLADMKPVVEGNHVYLVFEFTTGDAAGQNMVTIATEAICEHIKINSPIKPDCCFVEANLSGDKKATAQSFAHVRGKKVTSEVVLPADLVEQGLNTAPQRIVDYWRISTIGSVLSSAIGVQGHYANGLAALFLACGQDTACVAESAVGVTRAELTRQGDLYVSVTLPSLMVGTVGGGTSLPSQKSCLEIMGLYGPGKAAALAEVCASVCLAGELSIAGALCTGDFTRAHRCLARRRKNPRLRPQPVREAASYSSAASPSTE